MNIIFARLRNYFIKSKNGTSVNVQDKYVVIKIKKFPLTVNKKFHLTIFFF